MAKGKSVSVKVGGVDEYIAGCPENVQDILRGIRSAIRKAAPGASETVSYFDIPGYFYEGFDYNGMFVWFSFKSPYVRLHLRPPVILNHEKELEEYKTTRSIVNFPMEKDIPATLVSKLVKASLKVMKDQAK